MKLKNWLSWQKSPLAQQARKFLAFLHMSSEQRLTEIAAQPTAREQREYGDDALSTCTVASIFKFKKYLHSCKTRLF